MVSNERARFGAGRGRRRRRRAAAGATDIVRAAIVRMPPRARGDWCGRRPVLLGRQAPSVRTRCVCADGAARLLRAFAFDSDGANTCCRTIRPGGLSRCPSALLRRRSGRMNRYRRHTDTPRITCSQAHADVVPRSAFPAVPLPSLCACVRLSFAPCWLAPRGCAAGPWPWRSHARSSRPRMALAGTDAAPIREAMIRMRACSIMCVG